MLTHNDSRLLFQAGLPFQFQHAVLEELTGHARPKRTPWFGLPVVAKTLIDVTIMMLLSVSEEERSMLTRNKAWATVKGTLPVEPQLLDRLEEYDLNFATGLAHAVGAMMYLAGLGAGRADVLTGDRDATDSVSYPAPSQLAVAITELLATTSDELMEAIRRHESGGSERRVDSPE